MQRSKQQALMFLLGAVLVGGVLGFSADRVMAAKKKPSWGIRTSFYDDLGITTSQREKMDSILDESICKTEELYRPVKPTIDSVKAQSRRDWLAVMTPEQRTAMDLREAKMRARRDSLDKLRAAERAARGDAPKDHQERSRRCGGSGPRPGGPGGGDRGPGPGPGGPFFH